MTQRARTKKSLLWFRRLFSAFVIVLCVGQAAPVSASERVAVVIGNTDYDIAPLANPGRDARLIASVLAEFGFEIHAHFDLDHQRLTQLLEGLPGLFEGAEIGVFYFAGHGIQHRGENLLIGTDVTALEPNEVISKSLRVSELLSNLSASQGGSRIVMLDACRDNPFADTSEDFGLGLTYTEAEIAGEFLISYATSAGKVALDGVGLRNSPYAIAFVEALRAGKTDIYDIFKQVRRNVRSATNGRQVPWISASVEGDYVLSRSPQATETPTESPNIVDALDEVLWAFIRTSIDPADFEAFVRLFPSSRYAAEARDKASLQVEDIATAQVLVNGQPADPGILARGVARLRTAPTAVAGAAVTAESILSTDPMFGTTGDRVMPRALREWPDELPQLASDLDETVNDCDLLAADPDDPQRVAPGVDWNMLNTTESVRACVAALHADPENSRLRFQLGRSLDIAGFFDWAEHFYMAAGKDNYSAALVNHGYMYRTGRGRERDYARALSLYLEAGRLGNMRGRTNVGSLYRNGQGVQQSYEEAILRYRLAGANGWPNAIDALANMYRKGQGLPKDEVTAFELYMAAAHNGSTNAMSSVARAYLGGWGVEANGVSAVEWFERATARGNQYAPFFYARALLNGWKSVGIRAEPLRAKELFEASAERGFRQAYVELAKAYRDEKFGEADLTTALYYAYLARAAKRDDAEELVSEIESLATEADRASAKDRADAFLRQNGF